MRKTDTVDDLKGKLALIIDGACGIGKAVALALARRGARVIVHYFHSPVDAQRTCEEIAGAGGSAEFVRASVSRRDDIARMFTRIDARHGHLDILINNTADQSIMPIGEIAEAGLEGAFDANLKGAFRCAQHARALMVKRGGGVIVNVSCMGTSASSSSAKASVESLTRTLAAECAPLNIRVNAVAAAWTNAAVPARSGDGHKDTPTLPAQPKDIVDVVLFLTSDASRPIVGQTILADGGASLGTSVFMGPQMTQGEASRPLVLLEGPADIQATKETATEPETEDVAIVGIGLIVPGAQSPDQFWDVLMRGPHLFEPVPAERWRHESFHSADPRAEDKSSCVSGAFVKDDADDSIDADADRSVRWLRRSITQALQGVQRREIDRCSFVLGYSADSNQRLEESYAAHGIARRFRAALALLSSDAAVKTELTDRIDAHLQGRNGTSAGIAVASLPEGCGRAAMRGLLPDETELLTIDTACASSLQAVDVGMKSLLLAKCDIAVCAGAFAQGPLHMVLSSKLGLLSQGAEVRALDDRNDGLLLSEGAAVVVLKRLHRARQDGDRIWGVIKAVGSSASGRGKAMHAAALAGQRLALTRAYSHPAHRGLTIDWLLANAAGTPAADRIELEAICSTRGDDAKVYVTSNKSVIGHSGRVSGMLSLIQAVLAFDRQVIPPQHRYSQAPAGLLLTQHGIEIPSAPQAWAHRAQARHAGISSFGFGGTNAHLLLSENDDRAPPTPRRDRPYADRIALVAWAAHVPGLRTPEEIQQWLRDGRGGPSASFGAHYQAPAPVRLPPRTLRAIDRTQLMILACAHSLEQQLSTFWRDNRSTAGVFLGHMGKTRQAILYGHRAYLDDIHRSLSQHAVLSGNPLFEQAFQVMREDLARLVPPAGEDALTGSMPNVIAGRLASVFDLHGLALTCDAGFASSLVAFELAKRYLKSGELDLAIVGGINGNSDLEAADTLLRLGLPADTVPAEGAFLFALTRESTAREHRLPVAAYVYSAPRTGHATTVPAFDCGMPTPSNPSRLNYMGAGSALAVLRALHGDTEVALVRCRGATAYEDRCLRLERPAVHTRSDAGHDLAQLHAQAVRLSRDSTPSAQAIETRHVSRAASR